MRYVIMITVYDEGAAEWHHDDYAEARLTPEQADTVKIIYEAYHAAQRAWRMVARLRAQFRKAIEPLVTRKHQRWEQDAQAAEKLLQEVG